jgi:hypothetical protein
MSDAGIDAAPPGVIIPQTVVRAGDEAALGRASWGRFFSHVAFAVQLKRIWLSPVVVVISDNWRRKAMACSKKKR